MAKVEVEWVPSKAEPSSVTHWGRHDFSWWKRQSKSKKDQRPETYIVVQPFDAAGKRERGVDFRVDELSQAKAAAKQWVIDGGMSATVEAHVRIPFEGSHRIQDLGEYQAKEDRAVWLWDVRDDGMPYDRRGPYTKHDEAYLEARKAAQAKNRDQVVTFGSDPSARSFEILKAYKGGSGEVYFTSQLAHVGRRLGEYR